MPAGHCLPPDAFSSVNLIQGTHRARPWLQELRRPSLGVMGWVHLYTGCVILHEVHSEQASTDIQTRQARCAELLKNLFFVLTLQGKNAPILVHLFRFLPWVLATITHVGGMKELTTVPLTSTEIHLYRLEICVPVVHAWLVTSIWINQDKNNRQHHATT